MLVRLVLELNFSIITFIQNKTLIEHFQSMYICRYVKKCDPNLGPTRFGQLDPYFLSLAENLQGVDIRFQNMIGRSITQQSAGETGQ